jgi:UDP-3-O-[3-hydroxymyristoyl] N-acetylglucosamine deacetylase
MLPPLYQELLEAVPPSPEIPPRDAGVTSPPPDSIDDYRRAAAALARRLRELARPADLMRHLGMAEVAAGTSVVGREAPLPYPDAGHVYLSVPRTEVTVPYTLWVAPTVVPNVLYDVFLAVRGAFQKRTVHSPGHMHPAVNVTQGNAVALLAWLSEQVGFELRLPTEAEWEHVAHSTTTPTARQARKFDLDRAYMALAIDDEELAGDGADPLGLFGNVWEMTTPSLTESFLRLRGANHRLVDAHIYHAKGGGFQHCGVGADAPVAFPKFIAERTASTGFRFVVSEPGERQPAGGWRRRTDPISGHTVFDQFGIGHSSVQVVQSATTPGLSLKVNGTAHVIAPGRCRVVDLPRRGTALLGENGEIVACQPEHLLAALAGSDVWNACILLDGEPAPPASGYCAGDFAAAIERAGFEAGSSDELVVDAPISFVSGDSRAEILPGERSVEVEIDFPGLAGVGHQTARFDPDRDDFRHDIAPARSFVAEVVHDFGKEQERLADLRRYASPAEAPLLIFDGASWNHDFRFDNEPARHKLLDLLGDLSLLGLPLIGQVRVSRPGHMFNTELVRFLHELSRAGRGELSRRPS